MQDSLPAGGLRLYREGVDPLDHDKRFPIYMTFLLSRTYPDASWAHLRRRFFDIARGGDAPIASEALERIAALYAVEKTIRGRSAEERRAVRQDLSAALVADLEAWMREERPKLPRGSDVAKAMDYMLKRWAAFSRFLDDGRLRKGSARILGEELTHFGR